MHRSTTSAALLLTMAATAAAVAGCVSVRQPEPPALSPAAPALPAAPRPDGRAEPEVVQAPVREALDRMGRTPPPRSSAPPAPEPSRPPHHPPPPPRHEAPARSGAGHAARPAAPEPRRPRTAPPAAPGAPGDVCALGHQYGKWNPDSPEARICRETYGR
ncbi:hypothetical protein [Streptomyces antnestii]|uniref:hypothetical protein n=1 Tax=Streptomyces antnestii TaxID=2494256 RepID=UPI002950038B|nr:hypothetical protein [Streptomyces sp. San01]